METAKSNRIEWLDMLGGIAVLSVFVQHSMAPLITRLILAVHMPLFFFISGFLYKSRREAAVPAKDYVIKKFLHILLPWLLWFLIDAAITVLIELGKQSFQWQSFAADYWDSLLHFNLFWFLPCFFLAECFFHLLRQARLFKSENTLWADAAFMLLFFLASWVENRLVSQRLYFQLDTCLMAVGLLFWGSLFQNVFNKRKPSRGVSLWVGLGAGLAGAVFVLLNGEANFMMASNDYGNYLYALPAALLLTVSLIHLIWWTPWLPKKYLMFLRRNSLLLFPFHVELLRIVNLFLPEAVKENLWIYSLCCLTVIHAVMYPFCRFVNRYVPVLGGKQK